jgi:hypothetical protein
MPVPPELITGLIGLAGVIVGAGATTITGITAARSQRLQLAVGRDERQNDVRREACNAFLIRVSAVLDLARELVARLEQTPPIDALDEIHSRYVAEWHDLARAVAAVEIAGPPNLANAASELRLAVGGVADVCDAWYSARQRGPANARRAQFREANAAAQSARQSFIEQAQEWWQDPYQAARIARRSG